MKGQLLKALERKQLIDMMYIDINNKITKRRIKVTKVTDNSFSAYCFTKRSLRNFKIDSVLALLPVIHKERGVV